MRTLLAAVIVLVAGSTSGQEGPPRAFRQAVPTSLKRMESGWVLLRGGEPYFIRGAGGGGPKDRLAEAGANSFRTWGADDLEEQLDEAARLGMTVAAGIWLGHQRHGFDYDDPLQVARQREQVRRVILKFKDHPALLVWALGNEMEGYGKGDDATIWSVVNDLAIMAKSLDPNHPTMTVVAEIGGDRVRNLHRLCPDVDIVGINSYGGARSLHDRYLEAGGVKPYVVAEFGPPGPWEVRKTAWGAPIEPSSTEKMVAYQRSYEAAVERAEGLCLGSYAFLWGHKQEATATWFGMLLPDGSRLGAAETMSIKWSEALPKNRCPVIERLAAEGPTETSPGATVRARLAVADPESDKLVVTWIMQADPLMPSAGGDPQSAPPSYPEAITEGGLSHATVQMPRRPGGYRLFAYARDGHGGAAVANIPLYVRELPE